MREIAIWLGACAIVAVILLVMWPGRDNRSHDVEPVPASTPVGNSASK